MKGKLFSVMAMVVGLLLASGAVFAHHGGNLYDTTKAVEFKSAMSPRLLGCGSAAL